jgi:hypothetical protein
VKSPERSPWHRDDLPAWGWVAIFVLRVGQLVALLVPIALVVLLCWTWIHRRDPSVQRVLHDAGHYAGALADSLRSVLR